jgi:RimJ/RimL family protein N-acetyltransferase
MIKVAKKRALDSLVAYVRRDNRPMLKVFKKAGFTEKANDDFEEVSLVLPLLEKTNDKTNDQTNEK